MCEIYINLTHSSKFKEDQQQINSI